MKLGAPKFDLTDSDFDARPIWYCERSENPDVDFVFVPVDDVLEVTESICQKGNPCIPLQVEDTNWRCLGYFDIRKNTIFGLAIWMVDEWRGFNYIDGPRTPVTVIARVPILGVPDRRFCLRKPDDWYTEPLEVSHAV